MTITGLGLDGKAVIIAPGFTLTEDSLDLIPDAEHYGVERGALKRASVPEDRVGAALYLASPLAAFVTGQTMIVDGSGMGPRGLVRCLFEWTIGEHSAGCKNYFLND